MGPTPLDFDHQLPHSIGGHGTVMQVRFCDAASDRSGTVSRDQRAATRALSATYRVGKRFFNSTSLGASL